MLKYKTKLPKSNFDKIRGGKLTSPVLNINGAELKIFLVSILPGHGASTIAHFDNHSVDYRDWLSDKGIYDISKRSKQDVINDLNLIIHEYKKVIPVQISCYNVLVIYSSYMWEKHNIPNLKSSIFVSSSPKSSTWLYDGTYSKKFLFGGVDISKDLAKWRYEHSLFLDSTYCVNVVYDGHAFWSDNILNLSLETTLIYDDSLFTAYDSFCDNAFLNQYVNSENFKNHDNHTDLAYYNKRRVKMHLIYVTDREWYAFEHLDQFAFAIELSNYTGNFNADINNIMSDSIRHNVHDEVYIFSSFDWDLYKRPDVTNHVTIDKENNLIKTLTQQVEFDFIEPVTLANVAEIARDNAAHYFREETKLLV